MTETNQARKLSLVCMATCINFSAWGRPGYMQPSLFSFWTPRPISPKLIEVGIEIWYADGCVATCT